MAIEPYKKSFVIRAFSGALCLALAVIALAGMTPEVSPVLILLRLSFGLIYLIMIYVIVSAVWDRIARGLEALEAIEAQERSAQDATRQEDLCAILASIPPTDYLMRRT